jgi:hypothetical protein
MSDPIQPGNASRATTGTLGAEVRRAGDEAKAGAADLASKARDAAGGVRDEAAGLVQDVKAEGASVVEAARDHASGFAEEQQRAGAEQADGFARAIHRAADELQGTSPQIARYVHEAASSLGDLGRALRERSPGELIGGVEGLARRQPVAFFGAAVLAGFALARFAKSSAEDAHRPAAHGIRPVPAEPPPIREVRATDGGGGTVPPHTTATGAPGWVPDPDRPGGVGAKPATMAAASLGGAAARPGAAGRTGSENQTS